MKICYLYDIETNEFKKSFLCECDRKGNPRKYLYGTYTEPGKEKEGYARIFVPNGEQSKYDIENLDVSSKGEDGTWYYIEDHRQHTNEQGVKEGGTPYYLPEDTYISSPRYVEKLGSLPENATLEKPAEPLENARNKLRSKIYSAFERNDKKLIRTMANNETENTELLNKAQEHNRYLLANIDTMSDEEIKSAIPSMPEF